jgi:hypothetical protein
MDLSQREWTLLVAPPLAYSLLFVPVVRRAVRASQRFANALNALRATHNLAMALFSAAAAAAAATQLAKRDGVSPHALLCQPVEPAPLLARVWYLSKLAEWFDTALLLAAAKPLSDLHYNHHLTTATVVGAHLVGREVRTSIFDVPLLLNALVHTLMYSYYVSPALLRPIKKVLTSAQIVQHVTVLVAIVYTSATVASGSSCDVSLAANGLSLALYAMYLVQFLVFYGRTYSRSKPKTSYESLVSTALRSAA